MFQGNKHVKFYEINSLYGHDTFLLDVNNVGAAVKVRNGPEKIIILDFIYFFSRVILNHYKILLINIFVYIRYRH